MEFRLFDEYWLRLYNQANGGLDYRSKSWPDFVSEDRAAIFRSDSESLIQIFDAIRDWTLLRYYVCKSREYRKGARDSGENGES
jgi:hypothetical protein